MISRAIPYFQSERFAPLSPFLNSAVTLVPVPRSAPLVENALWPAKVIADALHAEGFCAEVLPCIRRVTAVRKSSTAGEGQRPQVAEHLESLIARRGLEQPSRITLVDDVLAAGRTMMACALRVQAAYPNAEIRAFAMLRTCSFVEDIDTIVHPVAGVIKYYPASGRTWRADPDAPLPPKQVSP